MQKGYKGVDPRAMKEDAKAVVSSNFERQIQGRINEYREQGFDDDKILAMLFDECSRPKSKEATKQKAKTKTFTYNSDIFKK
ncbi:MAG: hypothetical protein ACI31V_05845 [Bacilli bacterium]